MGRIDRHLPNSDTANKEQGQKQMYILQLLLKIAFLVTFCSLCKVCEV